MRLQSFLPILILLAGCEKEKNFNQRYQNTAAAIENQADTIDRDLQNDPARDGRSSR